MKRAHGEISSGSRLRVELDEASRRGGGYVMSVGKPMRIKVVMIDADSHAVRSEQDRQLALKLCLAGPDVAEVPEQDMLTFDPSPTIITGASHVELNITLNGASANFDSRQFCISAAVPEGNQHIEPAVSPTFTCARQHLRIRDDPDWESPWYKDEGGREKCITLHVDLVDSHGELVRGRPVPVQVTLMYEGAEPQPVMKQGILKISPETRMTISEQGEAVLRVRIEDVSKNHQGQVRTFAAPMPCASI